MRVLAWNIRHGGSKHQDLATALIAHDADVMVLEEHQHQKTSALIDHLRLFGWHYVAVSATPQDTGQLPSRRRTITSWPT